MGHYDNYDDYDRGNSRNGYGRGRSGGNRNGKPRKKTGCKEGTDKNGNSYLYGHKFMRGGMVMIMSAFADNGTGRKTEGTSSNGRDWRRMIVSTSVGRSFTEARQARPRITGGFYYADKGHLVIPELALVASPRTNYFGTYNRR